MRLKSINFLKRHRRVWQFLWQILRGGARILYAFIPTKEKKIAFTCLAGRKFDDSPRAIYEAICADPAFDDYDLVWFFIHPDEFTIPRGRKVKIDTARYVFEMLSSRVWVSNSGMDRGLCLYPKKTININTWHGTPLKKMGEDIHSKEAQGVEVTVARDTRSIRSAQSEYDLEIFQRFFRADRTCFLLCDLPRNDSLLHYTVDKCQKIRDSLGILPGKKVILYIPTFREYAWDENGENYLAPPMDMVKWKEQLSDRYVLLFRAHYAVTAALHIADDNFVKNVTDYPVLNDLYAIADFMISDYSSAFFDYAILDRPMLCFDYDYDEYMEKRGLYLDMGKELSCEIHRTEDSLMEDILTMNVAERVENTKRFHQKYTPYAGHATDAIVAKLKERLGV